MRRGNASGKLVPYAGSLLLVWALSAAPTQAEPVDRSRAALAARGWHQLRFQDARDQEPARLALSTALAPDAARPIVVKGITIAYAFDPPGGGCIAITADDQQAPVFYYSLHHRLTFPGVPAAQEIMESFAEKIAGFQGPKLRKIGTNSAHPYWALLTRLSEQGADTATLAALPSAPKGPLLTTAWSQDEPYNDKCPMYQNERCVVGCVATAMAQVMRYWRHPETGTDKHCYYWALGKESLCADFGATTYDWANMFDEVTRFSPPAAKEAVSTLSYHCGVSVDMGYSPYGSGAWHYTAAVALMKYFGYEPPQYLGQAGGMDIDAWYNVMCEQIDKNQPVLYGTETHEFVLDGYDSPNLVHFNMGWGGEEDGWYAIDHFPLESAKVDAVIDIRPFRFELMGIVKVPGDRPQLRWTSNPGGEYAVWSCVDLHAGEWTKEADISSQTTTTSWTDTSPLPGAKFYRIERKS